MPARKNSKEYTLTEAKKVPNSEQVGRKPASDTYKVAEVKRVPKVHRRNKGWAFITEPVPGRMVSTNIYDEIAMSFARGRARSVRLMSDDKTPKALVQGVRDAIKRNKLDGIGIHTRTVDEEMRIYLTK